MQTITLHSRVSADGILRLEVPLPADHADSAVRVTILPLTFPHKTPAELGYPPGFFGEVIGGWEGEPLAIDDPTQPPGGTIVIYLLDSNPCIVSLNEVNSSVARKIAVRPAEHISLCTIVQTELYYGAYRSSKPDM